MKIKLSKPLAANAAVDEFDVRQMKKALNRLGYYRPYEQTGITGIPDRAVFEALKRFQSDQGLQATGTARPDDETVSKLSRAAGQKKSGRYIWRTVGDGKVRDSHAALSGTVRDFADSPDPGEEFNCRCWAELLDSAVASTNCHEEREKYEALQKQVKELTKRFNDLILKLNELREEHNELIENAIKALGAQIVSYILTLPFDRLYFLNELLRRYFANIITNKLLQAADNFMRRLWMIKERIQHLKGQRDIVFAQLERTAKELESVRIRLEACEKNEKKS